MFLLLLSVMSLCAAQQTGSQSYENDSYGATIGLADYKTLKVTDMDGNPVTDFRYQRTMTAGKDDFLGVYIRESRFREYYLVRPTGGKPVRSITWRNGKGERKQIMLNGRSIGEYARDRDAYFNAKRNLEASDYSRKAENAAATPKSGINTFYNKWFEKEGVSATYISSEMMGMIRQNPQLQLDQPIDLTQVIQFLDCLYLLEFAEKKQASFSGKKSDGTKMTGTVTTQVYQRSSASGGLRSDIREILSAGGYKKLMEKREGDKVTRFYAVSDGKVVSSFILVRMDMDYNYGQFFCVEGRIPQAKFEAFIVNGMNP